jgi:membrane fusion protein (multidrug efflux system)
MADERAAPTNGEPAVQGPIGVAPPAQEAKAKGSVRNRVIIGVAAAVVAVFAWWLYARQYEDTDDAQIDGNIGAVSARVPGTVTKLHVTDNQVVNAGDLLIELDPADLEVALLQAKAAVAQADAQVQAETPAVPITQTSNRALVETADRDVAQSRAELEQARREQDQAQANERWAQLQRDRGKQLVATNVISQADFDQRVTGADAAAAALAGAKKKIEEKEARLATSEARLQETRQNAPRQLATREANLLVRRANLDLAQAQLKQAQLNLSYAQITAPFAGVVGRKSVNVGDRVQPGQQLLALTQTSDLWVTANFRETQIQHMRAGQKADVHVDALSRSYRGVVESFAGATGSRYSLLPPENASGNYVKVVQRIPVRIRLDPGQPEMDRLRPGMSAEPKVRVR